MHDFWPASGHHHLDRTPGGRLRPTDAYLRHLLLELSELALVEESCGAEVALREALLAAPSRPIGAAELDALQDADASANYAAFLAFRDALLAAGTLEAYYLGLMRSGRVNVPPALVDRIVQAIVRHLLDDCTDAFEARAGELLFRPQRVTLADGRMLAADRETADRLADTGGLGDIGRLLRLGDAPLPAATLDVLSTDNAAGYWHRGDRHDLVLDLTHELDHTLDHGLTFRLTHAHSGLKALARVLEKWLAHLLGVDAAITPLREIDDAAWRWHVGLDAASMALLNDLYEGRQVEPERLRCLISLFRLEFGDSARVLAEVAGKPVYLGLATADDGTLRLKPQNLLLNLPLAAAAPHAA